MSLTEFIIGMPLAAVALFFLLRALAQKREDEERHEIDMARIRRRLLAEEVAEVLKEKAHEKENTRT